jgi:flagellar biogenesis protein FliO
MEEDSRSRNFLSLFIGIAFVGYGGYRLVSFYLGAPFNTFRIIVDMALVLFGAWDIYRFFKKNSNK